jgi:hypothetical protein
MRSSLGNDQDQGAEVPTVVGDGWRRARPGALKADPGGGIRTVQVAHEAADLKVLAVPHTCHTRRAAGGQSRTVGDGEGDDSASTAAARRFIAAATAWIATT